MRAGAGTGTRTGYEVGRGVPEEEEGSPRQTFSPPPRAAEPRSAAGRHDGRHDAWRAQMLSRLRRYLRKQVLT